MLDSCKFQGFVAKFSRYLPLSASPVPIAMTTPKRTYHLDGADFTLEPVNDSVTKVTHRDQVGWIGISADWEAQQPYTWTTVPKWVGDDGIHNPVFNADTPDGALMSLCRVLLIGQSKEDSKNINPQERKAAAQRVLEEFLHNLPPDHPHSSSSR